MTAPTAEAPTETGALIDHILSRYHERHRLELPGLLDLAEKVGRVHATDHQCPKDLAQSLTALGRELEGHMAKEEMILFPAMRAGGGAGIGSPVAVMRAEHDDHAEAIERIRKMTGNLTPPDHACGSWRALYAGLDRFLEDLAAHVALENHVLFPRFERG